MSFSSQLSTFLHTHPSVRNPLVPFLAKKHTTGSGEPGQMLTSVLGTFLSASKGQSYFAIQVNKVLKNNRRLVH